MAQGFRPIKIGHSNPISIVSAVSGSPAARCHEFGQKPHGSRFSSRSTPLAELGTVANYAINRAYAHAGTGPPPVVQPGHTVHAMVAVFGAHLIYCPPLLRPDKWQCVSCLVGSNSTNKAGCLPLAGRDVSLWPDIDEPGAASFPTFCNHLRYFTRYSRKPLA